MELIQITCPSCGGKLNIENKSEAIFCNYCGNKFLLPKDISNTTNIENYMKLADSAVGRSNNDDAINYYNKILEIEPNNYKATIGKGLAIFFKSTLDYPHLDEMVDFFKKGYELAPKDEKNNASMVIKANTYLAAKTYFDMAKNHFQQFGNAFSSNSENMKVNDEFHRNLMRIITAIEDVLKIPGGDVSMIKLCAELGIEVVKKGSYFKDTYISEEIGKFQTAVRIWEPSNATQSKSTPTSDFDNSHRTKLGSDKSEEFPDLPEL